MINKLCIFGQRKLRVLNNLHREALIVTVYQNASFNAVQILLYCNTQAFKIKSDLVVSDVLLVNGYFCSFSGLFC
jgi:hypothetical protein